ncbi:hypothetical protein M9435_004154 [Picochlorum sp. BPE23]|nr:hypothetical protein M9435_004154 [Picochlorum sp. BPE23]|mmetsp:Transcript_2324/g.4697  ORF Transcript_2324/g.4697 Transcript_2324/m.4697 type:complete len:212 (+) Transcript_2324:98-733(+)
MIFSARLFSASVVLALVGCAAADVEVKAWFPDSPSLEFVVGQPITAILGVRNNGPEGFNVTAVQGNLALVTDPSGNVFNFTGAAYQYPEMGADEEVVVQYIMPLPKNLPPRDFYLSLKLFSQGEDILMKQAFNETISFVEESKLIDFELLGLYAIFIAIVAVIVYSVYSYAVGQGWVKKPKAAKKTEVRTSDKSEWLKGTIADKNKSSKQN